MSIFICHDGGIYKKISNNTKLSCVGFEEVNGVRMIRYVNTGIVLPDEVVIDWCINKVSTFDIVVKYRDRIVTLLRKYLEVLKQLNNEKRHKARLNK